jgi:hypothetical protein
MRSVSWVMGKAGEFSVWVVPFWVLSTNDLDWRFLMRMFEIS